MPGTALLLFLGSSCLLCLPAAAFFPPTPFFGLLPPLPQLYRAQTLVLFSFMRTPRPAPEWTNHNWNQMCGTVLGMGREEGEERGHGLALKGEGSGDGRWETLGMLSLPQPGGGGAGWGEKAEQASSGKQFWLLGKAALL